MVLFDAAVHVHAAVFAGVALDHGGLVDDLEFVLARANRQFVYRDDCDDAEQRTVGLPALGAAAGVVELDVRVERYFHGAAGAFAVQFAAGEVGVAFLEAGVDEGVKGGHCCFNMGFGGSAIEVVLMGSEIGSLVFRSVRYGGRRVSSP